MQNELIKVEGFSTLIALNDRRHCLSFIIIMTQTILIFEHNIQISVCMWWRLQSMRVRVCVCVVLKQHQ